MPPGFDLLNWLKNGLGTLIFLTMVRLIAAHLMTSNNQAIRNVGAGLSFQA